MTVNELIHKLAEMPGELMIVWNYDDYEFQTFSKVELAAIPKCMMVGTSGETMAVVLLD